MNKPTVIFVLGMHRSGTSALAGALAASGVWLGRDLLEPAAGVNDKGFWEHKELVRINESLLELAGLHWFAPLGAEKFASFLNSSPETLDALKDEGRAFVRQLLEGDDGEGADCVAIKDPRLCLTADFWKPLFEDAGVRVTGFELVRHPAEVGRSLAKRDGIVPSHSNVLWLDHVLASADFCRHLQSCYIGSFDELMASPLGFTGSALKDLGVDLQPDQAQMNRWIQEDLRHHKTDASKPGGLLGDDVALMYEDILQRRSVDDVTAEKLVSGVSEVFDDIERLFESYNHTVVQLQDVSERLDQLGKEHSRALDIIQQRDDKLEAANAERDRVGGLHQKALEMIQQRDQKLEKANAERDRVGALHQAALDTISARDTALATVRVENERLSDEVVAEKERGVLLDEQLAELGDNHHYALQVVEERDRQLAELNQRIAKIESSIIGKLLRLRGRLRQLTRRAPSPVTESELIVDEAFSGTTEFPIKGQRPSVDVIVPVYGGFDETCAAISTASESIDRSWARLVVINDCSPEPAITRWLRENRELLDYELVENEKNLGFVGTVNRGMRLHPDADVLLLNSDVEVANDWLERLQDCAYSRDRVASVTATANNATICSFPVFCEDNELLQGFDVQSLDVVFRDSVPANMAVEIPSGVGCCMYMRRDAMDAVGLFDEETFGRGYGEENDWCQRVILDGRKNLHALNVFVYHKGAVSFSADSSPLIEKNLQVLGRRYPTYHGDVQEFIGRDPAFYWRMRTMCAALASSARPPILAISHGLGGGVVTHIKELERELSEVNFIHLEPKGGETVQLVIYPTLAERSPVIEFRMADQYEDFLKLCKALGVCHVHFHHTLGLPTRLWGLPSDLGVRYDYTLHDFWVVNGNPTLTDKSGLYAGNGSDRDELCAQHYPLPDGVSAERWRHLQLPLMQGARYIITPSFDTRDRIAQEATFKGLSNWRVSPHLDHQEIPSDVDEFAPDDGIVRVAVLGALSREKGADILEAVADCLKDEPIEFHLLGYAYRPLSRNVITHGAYPEEEALTRLVSLKPDIVWFTAQWPETYSYTLSVALKARMPIIAPELGAFVERLALRERTVLLNSWQDIAKLADFWRSVCEDYSLINAASVKDQGRSEVPADFYCSEYLEGLLPNESKSHDSGSDLNRILESVVLSNKSASKRTKKERILGLLLRVRKFYVVAKLTSFIPLKWQKKLKRQLSRRPLHELDH